MTRPTRLLRDIVHGFGRSWQILVPLLDGEAFHQPLRRHPQGWVQMYLRDPAGNLVEVDCPDISTLEPEIQAQCGRLEDEVAQTGEASQANLYS